MARNKLENLIPFSESRKEREYNSLMEKAEKIILYEDNPGKRLWDLQGLAKRHGLSAQKLEEIYYKHLLHKDSTPSMTWDELIKHESDSPDWVYHGFMLRGSLTLLYSAPGVGKTLFFYFLAFCAAAGVSWETKIGQFSATAKRRRILFVQCDETRPEMIRSLRRLGFDATLQCQYLTDWNVNEIPKLIREIQSFKPDAIIIDSLSSVGDWTVEENNTRFAVPVNMLRRLAGLFNCWIGLTHHANAEGGLRGTTAIAASASTVIKMERIQGQPLSSSQRKLIFQKNRAGTPWSAHCQVNFETGGWQILEGVEGTGIETVGVQGKIYSFLKENSPKRYETREMAEILAQAQPSIRRACNQLSGLGLISKVQLNRKCLYFVQRDEDEWDDASPDPGGDHGDHVDPEAITGDGSHPNSFQQGDSASSDHAIAQNQKSDEQFEDEKIDDRLIASAETTLNQEVECDPARVIASGSLQDRIAIENYRGLTIKQPHAQRFSQGLKRYEVRSRKTNYRGLILIHSSKEYEKGFGMDRTLAEVEYPTGKILAVAELTDCIEITESFLNEQPEEELFGGYWQLGQWAWKLENIRPVHPYPGAAGNFMLWTPQIDHLEGVEIGDRVDVNNDSYVVPEIVGLIQELLEVEGGKPWVTLRNIKGLSKRQRNEILRRLLVTGRGYRIIWDGNNPDWGVIDPALIKRKELIDLRSPSKSSKSVYAFCQGEDGSTEYFDVFDEFFFQDDRREIPKLSDREKAEAKQKAFEKVMKALGEHEGPGAEPVTDDEAPGVEPVTDDEAPGVEPVTDDEAPGVEPVTDDEASGVEPVTTPDPDIFDQIQVGDRLISNNGATCICIKKKLNPKQITVRWGGGSVTELDDVFIEIMRLQIKTRLRPGLRVRYQHWHGRLSSKLKNNKWYVNWEGFFDQGLRKKYGEPPKSAIAPQDFEVVE
ncbi:AAA family ATPase [Coleofasciculus chthonoplastes]|uniref:AAA family ATPase n=1 Tax=Coleofasciculus chthonoplastes TaxID=64178 RepID=UPI004064ABCE